MEIGESYKVIELQKYGGELKIKTKQFRELKKNEILVKIHATTMHPADLAFIQGQYGLNKPQVPFIPGFEGSGEIVKVGEDVDNSIVNKRCGLFKSPDTSGNFEGLWAQYTYTTLEYILPFNKEIQYDKIALSLGNPLTAAGFIDTLRKTNSTTVGQSGASSAFGKIFIKLCAKEGIKTVNIVRKKEHIESLKKLGADSVISTSDSNWEEDLNKELKSLNVTTFFDCVGGDVTGKIISALPPRSYVYHFGNLQLERLGELDTSDFIFKEKYLKGWWLMEWVINNPESAKKWSEYIVDDIEKGSDTFLTEISGTYKLEEFEKAFEKYLTNMGAGKVLIYPNNNL